MRAFDPTKHEIRILKVTNGFIVNVACKGPIVFENEAEMVRELLGFFAGKLGPVGQRLWDTYVAQIKEMENSAGAATPTALDSQPKSEIVNQKS